MTRRPATTVHLVCWWVAVVSGLLGGSHAVAQSPPALNEKRLLRMQADLESFDGRFEMEQWKEDGEEMMPYFEWIIAHPYSDRVLERAFYFARKNLTKYDCKRLVEPTVAHLMHHEWEIKAEAISLLRLIGNNEDAAPVVALLHDDEKRVRTSAAWCLEKIGGKRELLALDIWLRGKNAHKDEAFDAVKKSRDALRARVEAEEKKLKAKPADPKGEKKDEKK